MDVYLNGECEEQRNRKINFNKNIDEWQKLFIQVSQHLNKLNWYIIYLKAVEIRYLHAQKKQRRNYLIIHL